MKTKGLIFTALAGAILLFFNGCQQFDNDKPGRLIVRITDDPFPIDLVEAANVYISKVEIRTEADTAGYPFMTLFEGSMEFNLLELRNGITAELVNMPVPPGEYNLIRMYVDSASITVKDHGTYSVKVPSGAQTGIKIFIEPSLVVAGGLTAELLLDFNLDQSFVLQGDIDTPAGIKGFHFKPVIRAVNNTEAGVVEGTVMNSDTALYNAAVWIGQDTVLATAYADEEGYYAITGVPAGFYNMWAAMEGFDTISVSDVRIVEGNLTVQDFILDASTEE